MKNLNKFTKAELINKYTKLENNNSNQSQSQSKFQSILKIIDKILLFKSLILKITLITLLIKWIKKYSLVKKLWHVFSIIGNALLGFTLIDIYSWDVISWIKDTSIYKWYADLFYKTDIISNKKEDIPSRMSEINQNSNENQTNSQRSSRIIEWINRDSEKTKVDDLEVLNQEELNSIVEKTDNSNYKNYFILGSILIISGIVWYYWSDIRPAAGDAGNTIIEKIRSFRSWFNNDSNNIINNNPGNNQMDIQTNVNNNNEIQLSDNTQPPTYNQTLKNKGKTVLTSPSLENLNEQAESSWSEELSSPDSDKTITPASISKSNASSSSLLNASNLIIKNTWRARLSKEVNDKINFVESSLMNENPLDIELADYFAYIINEYNSEIQVYNYIKSKPEDNLEMLNGLKESLYYFREWIAKYQNKIFTSSNVTIEIGSINDSPKNLTKNIV